MRTDKTDSGQKIQSGVQAMNIESPNSSKIKLSGMKKTRKIVPKNITSALLQKRQMYRYIENDVDITPKLLTHPTFSSIDEHQMTAFEVIGLSQAATASVSQLMVSPSGISTLKTGSFTASMTSSFNLSAIIDEEVHFESLLSTQTIDSFYKDEAPSQFYLPSTDPNIFPTQPETLTLILRETETVILFELQPRTGDIHTPEGQAIKEENEMYEYKTVGAGSNRKLVDSESQTLQVLTQSRGTLLSRKTCANQSMSVSDWVIYDTYNAPELMLKKNDLYIVHRQESMEQLLQSEELKSRLPKIETQLGNKSSEDELTYIFQHVHFWNAVQVMERIIASNIFIHAQKRFTGLIRQDPCNLDLEFTYSLDLLWMNTSELSEGRPVSAFRWNYKNKTILAVAYGAKEKSQTVNGLILLWSAKNPDMPARSYIVDNPVASIDWSRDRPNLLAVGFYNGNVVVIDVSSRNVNIVRKGKKATSLSRSPQWQVQWWRGDEQFEYQEQIYTCDQDGCVYCYRYVSDFTSTKIMKIYRMEGTLPGVSRTATCKPYNVSFNRSPGALVLRKHPTSSTFYFVASDEGCIYKCSTTYLYLHVESFLAHDGPVYSMMFSPFSTKVFLTCGADWCIRIWVEGLTEPLITMATEMACVRYAAWSPIHSTIIVSIVNNEICIWDIKRKTHAPSSVTVSPNSARFVMIDFSSDGHKLVAADVEGAVYLYNLEGMPFPPYNQEQVLVESIEKALITKPNLLKKLKKIGPPFSR